jgi:hypothetical protein
VAKVNLNIKAPSIAIERGAKFAITLPERADILPQALQDIARHYLSARRRSGESLLEAARHLSEARLEAKHGEWAIFLEAIGLDESRARAQIRIHEEAQRDPLFADRIVNGFLSETVARELLPLPAEAREELLTRETPPTAQDVREAKRVVTPVLEPAVHKFPPDLIAQAESLGIKLGFYDDGKKAFFYLPDGRTDRGDARDLIRVVQRLMPQPTAPAEQAPLPDMPAPESPADLPPEFAIVQRRMAKHDHELTSYIQGQHRAYAIKRPGMTGVVVFDWADVLSRQERLEADTAPVAPEKLPAHLATCVRCGAERTPYRTLTSYQAGLVEEYPDRVVTLCSRCIPELLAARKKADESTAPVEEPTRSDVAPTIEVLDATLPQSLSDAGFYWKAAEPPTIAHNDGWYTTAETVEAALNLAHDRAQERVEANDRRLTPGAHAQAVSLLVSIRTDLITNQVDSAERHTRQLLAVIEKGEAED